MTDVRLTDAELELSLRGFLCHNQVTWYVCVMCCEVPEPKWINQSKDIDHHQCNQYSYEQCLTAHRP